MRMVLLQKGKIVNQVKKRTHPFKYILTTCFKVRPIKAFLKKVKRGKLLDVGCGSGFMLSQLDGEFQESFGIDLSPEAVEFGKNFTHANLQVANAEKLPFEDNYFDCIVATDSFEHIPDDVAAIKEAKRVLVSGGKLIIYVPSDGGLLSNTPFVDMYHTSEKSYLLDQRYYSIQTLSKLVTEAGFKINYIGYHNLFFQEFFTQSLKAVAKIMGKEYEHQGDITNLTNSKLYPIYRYILLPFFKVIVRIEEFIAEKIFRAKIRGHRIIAECEA